MLTIPRDFSNARILVTNDDGVGAEGIAVLTRVARSLSRDVWVVAPESEQSGAGHSLSLSKPLRVNRLGARRFSVTGTPTDCVLLAVQEIIPKRKKVDLILSGINRGSNVAEDVTYSGTIAATMEGTLMGIASVAFSQVRHPEQPMYWATGEAMTKRILPLLAGYCLPKGNLLSVNIPHCPLDQVKGIHTAPLGQRAIDQKMIHRLDPKGVPYYWIGGGMFWEMEDAAGTDHTLVKSGYTTITPISLDMTNYQALTALGNHLEATNG